MTLDYVAMLVGYFVLSLSATTIFLLSIIGICLLLNRVQNHIVDTMDGFKLLGEFKQWYRSKEELKHSK